MATRKTSTKATSTTSTIAKQWYEEEVYMDEWIDGWMDWWVNGWMDAYEWMWMDGGGESKNGWKANEILKNNYFFFIWNKTYFKDRGVMLKKKNYKT
jgi:hypothetical protein